MIRSGPRRRRAALLAALAIELLAAGWWRWPVTVAPIETSFDYGSGHVAIVSENWRRAGALRQHLLPVMSTDRDLPEWPYRTLYSQEYYSVPPLAFILHYSASRLLPWIEPVLLAKLLAQALICISVLLSAALLAAVFDAWAVFVGLSFLITGVPFLLWYANGYFAVNVGLAAQLVLVGWCAGAVAPSIGAEGEPPAPGAGYAAIGGVLAFLGAFADYMPLAANGTAFAGLVVLAFASARRPAQRRFAWRAAFAVAAGSIAAVGATLALYARQMGFDRYRDALTQRVAQRSGEAPVLQHLEVIRRQMLTAWPPGVLVTVAAVLSLVLVLCATAFVMPRVGVTRPRAAAILFLLAVAFVPSIGFHYRAFEYVSVHWWFAGTWTIGWTVALCAFADLVRRRGPHGAAWCVAFAAMLVWANLRFTAAQTVVDAAHFDAVRMYRDIGRQLPHDGLPLVTTDLAWEEPGLFEDFPFTTAYLRRPILIRDADGLIRLPAVHEMYEGKPLSMGGEDAADKLRRLGGDVYIAFDPGARTCLGVAVAMHVTFRSEPVAVCRAHARDLVDEPSSVLGPLQPDYACSAPPLPPEGLHIASNRGGGVTVAWWRAATRAASYVLEVGRAAGQSDALVARLGRVTEFTARGVLPGTYFVRVRGHNRCGTGAPSEELIVEVK